MNCSSYIDKNYNRIVESIRKTMQNEHEHAFGFSSTSNTPVILGNCDDVARPTIKNMIGTFHTHTIERSKPSEDDFKIFLQTRDKLMCYARPVDNYWNVRCYERDMGVCGETDIKI
jgi:hypothetical protein